MICISLPASLVVTPRMMSADQRERQMIPGSAAKLSAVKSEPFRFSPSSRASRGIHLVEQVEQEGMEEEIVHGPCFLLSESGVWGRRNTPSSCDSFVLPSWSRRRTDEYPSCRRKRVKCLGYLVGAPCPNCQSRCSVSSRTGSVAVDMNDLTSIDATRAVQVENQRLPVSS